jgi:predicted acetyltransferase
MLYTNGNIVKPTPLVIEESIGLMTKCMREENSHAKSGYLLDKEYPNVFKSLNYDNIWSLKENGSVVSALAAYPFKIKINESIFNAVGIGSVSTHPAHRKKGLSAKLHKMAIDYYSQINHYDFAILWTDMFDYYRKFDYELVGEEVVFVIDSPVNPRVKNVKIKQYDKSQLEGIHSLYETHENCAARTIDDFETYLKIPDMHIATAFRKDKLVAYAICGKGSDLEATVHEWGGDIDALLHLLNYHLKREGRNVSLISAQGEPLLDELTKQHLKPYIGHLGMIRILDVNSFQKKLNIDGLRLTKIENSEKVKIEYYEHKTTIDLKTLSKLCFGPETADEILGNGFKELSQSLPVSFFVWGLDSV